MADIPLRYQILKDMVAAIVTRRSGIQAGTGPIIDEALVMTTALMGKIGELHKKEQQEKDAKESK